MATANEAPGQESSSDELCYRIVSAVAEERGIDVMDVDERLYDVLDAEALDELVDRHTRAHSDEELDVRFTMAGCEVVVTGDREIRVTAREE